MAARADSLWRAMGEREAADMRDLMNRIVDVPLPRLE